MIIEWINSNERAVLKRLAELIAVNGGQMTVKGAGRSQASDDNRYGRVGLTLQEAMELIYLNGFWDAMSISSTAEAKSEAHKLIGMEMNNVGGLSDIAIPTPEEVKVLLGR